MNALPLSPRPRPRSRPRALVLAATLPLAGCFVTSGASSSALPLVRAHAEADLVCPSRDIRIEQKLGGRFEAIGCGQKTVYLTACEGLRCVVGQEGGPVPWRARPDPTPTP